MTSSNFESRLHARAEHAGLSLPANFASRAERFYELLQKWNAATNLTALPLDGYPVHSLDRLFIEPLLAAELIPSTSGQFCVDIGSGGGSPAIPFALAQPGVRMLMVESVGKKAAFLREAVRAVGLSQAEVRNARFEDLGSEFKHTIDLILIRAVKITPSLSRALQDGLKPDGKLLAFGATPEIVEFNWRLSRSRDLSDENALMILEIDR